MKTTKNAEKKQLGIGIKLKLIVGFSIPLICTIIIGMVAYSLAASGMTANYEDSMSKALIMAVEYVDFGFASAVSESEQLYYNVDLLRWATGAIYNDWTKKEVAESVTMDLSVKQRGNPFIENIYIIPKSTLPVVSAYESERTVPGFYDTLAASSEAECFETLSGNWVGLHTSVDAELSKHYDGYTTEDYACSYIRPMPTRKACIVVDYSSDSIADVLKGLELGDDSVSAFVTADGRELLLQNDTVIHNGEFSFLDQTYYQNAMADNAATIIEYVQYKNQEYLFMLSKSHENGSAICAMVPVSRVRAGANSIKNVTVFIVILSCAIAILAGMLIIVGITTTIKQLSNKLKTVSGGDLTVTMNTNRKDEFRMLVKSIADMVKNSRDLIVKVLHTSEEVSSSTEKLAEVSDVLTSSNDQIFAAIDEMDKGLNQQSADAQDCLVMMDELSNKITDVVDTIKKMNAVTDDTKSVIQDGMATMDELSSRSSDTTDITRTVTSNIKNLEGSLTDIENFVSVINGIAEETNLLALNASIEAARAGEAGRGFAVVAQSVSKLSDGTIEAANQIQSVMEQIRREANDTVVVATKAENIVMEQSDAVKDTISAFKNTNQCMEVLMGELISLKAAIDSIEKHRNNTLNAIESISSVSEETAASISLVNESVKRQITIVDNLHNSTKNLEDKAKVLNEAVNAFKISEN